MNVRVLVCTLLGRARGSVVRRVVESLCICFGLSLVFCRHSLGVLAVLSALRRRSAYYVQI
jgi:hypothetical protein